MSDDPAARIAALEHENTELRARVAELEADVANEARAGQLADAPKAVRKSRPQVELLTPEDARRSRFAKLMLAGGALAILGGIFASSWFAVICGLGWLFGGAAVASTVPQSGGDS